MDQHAVGHIGVDVVDLKVVDRAGIVERFDPIDRDFLETVLALDEDDHPRAKMTQGLIAVDGAVDR